MAAVGKGKSKADWIAWTQGRGMETRVRWLEENAYLDDQWIAEIDTMTADVKDRIRRLENVVFRHYPSVAPDQPRMFDESVQVNMDEQHTVIDEAPAPKAIPFTWLHGTGDGTRIGSLFTVQTVQTTSECQCQHYGIPHGTDGQSYLPSAGSNEN